MGHRYFIVGPSEHFGFDNLYVVFKHTTNNLSAYAAWLEDKCEEVASFGIGNNIKNRADAIRYLKERGIQKARIL